MTLTNHGEAVPLVVTAVAEKLAATAAVTNLLASSTSVYRGEAPMKTSEKETPAPYIVVTNPAGQDTPGFGKVGGTVRCSIDIWAVGQLTVENIYPHVAAALHRQALTIAGARYLRGTTQLLGVIRDPGKRRLYHGVVTFEAIVST